MFEVFAIRMPLGELTGVAPGNEVEPTGKTLRVKVGKSILGKVLDGLGRPINDEKLRLLYNNSYCIS